MKIRYHVSRKDLWSVVWRISMQSPVVRILPLPLLALVWVSNFRYEEYSKLSLGERVGIATASSLFVLLFFVIVMFLMIAVQVYVAKKGGTVGDHTLEILDEGLREVSSAAEITSRWSAIRKVRKTSSVVIIRTAAFAHMIPTKFAMLEGDLAEFLGELDRRIGQPNKRPEGTEGKSPPSKHSQPPSVPHP